MKINSRKGQSFSKIFFKLDNSTNKLQNSKRRNSLLRELGLCCGPHEDLVRVFRLGRATANATTWADAGFPCA
jgi:hypothetical protein